ncbi:hypothetical protein BDV98DRAFT_574235 [Pterulicium gracile]|uniref:Uncharacterized protein n=1 Tax=Pterulicium gracile TaxID=1884261 RepID=A0A5C3Q910_9AGAR|nr:hypothetical protein BDV98DRAFT_574235 [Pterula gracilis]
MIMKVTQVTALAVYLASAGVFASGPIEQRQILGDTTEEPSGSPSPIFNPSGSFSVEATNTPSDSITDSISNTEGTAEPTADPTDAEPTPSDEENPEDPAGSDGAEGSSFSVAVGGGLKVLVAGVVGIQVLL